MQDPKNWAEWCVRLYFAGTETIGDKDVRLEYSSMSDKWSATISDLCVYGLTPVEAMDSLTELLHSRARSNVRNLDLASAFGKEVLYKFELEKKDA